MTFIERVLRLKRKESHLDDYAEALQNRRTLENTYKPKKVNRHDRVEKHVVK